MKVANLVKCLNILEVNAEKYKKKHPYARIIQEKDELDMMIDDVYKGELDK